MRILVTNDDGIEAEGLHALVRACEAVGQVTVVAPHHDRSARRGMPADALLNVNVPNLGFGQIRGVRVTRQSARRYRSRLEAEPGTDSHALSQGYVSVTPLQMDLTHPQLLSAMAAWELDRLLASS